MEEIWDDCNPPQEQRSLKIAKILKTTVDQKGLFQACRIFKQYCGHEPEITIHHYYFIIVSNVILHISEMFLYQPHS